MKIITHVAHLFDNQVISLPEPYRHHHLFRMMKDHPSLPRWDNRQGTPEVQGFLTSEGMFVDRLDALKLFEEYGQTNYDVDRSQLYSENCWPGQGDWQAAEGTAERARYDHIESSDTITALLKIEPFIGSTAPYRITTILSDIFYREGVIINLVDYDFDERIGKKLYSQLYETPLEGEAMLERIQHYFSVILKTNLEVKDARSYYPRQSAGKTKGDVS